MINDMINNCMVALITPFKNDEVDYDALGKIIDNQIKNNVSLLACGTTAETATLDDEEYKAVIEFVVKKADKKIFVMAGCGTNSTKKTIEKAKFCESAGVDALLVVTPYYNKTTQEGLYMHYKTIAQSVSLPLVLYNVPARTGLDMDAKTVIRLSKIPNIVGLKEASGNILKVQEILSGVDANFAVYSGNDDIVIPMMSLGARGVISVASNAYPKKVRQMVDSFLSRDIETAGRLQLHLTEFSNLIFSETNPIPIKKACSHLGLCFNELRLPLVPMSEKNAEKLIGFMEKFDN